MSLTGELALAAGPADTTRMPRRRVIVQVAEPVVRLWPEKLALVALVGVALAAPLPLGGHHAAAWAGLGIGVAAIGLMLLFFSSAGFALTWWPVLGGLVAGGLAGFAVSQALSGAITPETGGFGTVGPGDSALAAIRHLSLGLFFALCFHAISAADDRYALARRVGNAIVAGVVGFAVFALLTEARKFGPEGGIVGPFANRNSFATFLGMGLILALSLVLSQQNAHQNPPTRALGVIGGLVAVLVLLLALFATQSRMGVAASLIGATIALLSQPRHRIIGGLGALIALGVLAFVALGHGIADRFSLIAVDWQIRLDFYRQIADLIALRPFAGYGADGFALAYEAAHRPPVSADFVWDRAHSTYLKLWLEYGLVIGSLPVIGAVVCFVALIGQA